jgi:hypothetical protein
MKIEANFFENRREIFGPEAKRSFLSPLAFICHQHRGAI